MKQTLLLEKYPIYVAEISKDATDCNDIAAVVAYLRDRIAANEKVSFIDCFDHFAHTKAIGGEVAPDIKAAVDIIFCFGVTLPNPQVLAVRPRSIGVADMGDRYVLSFLEAPMQFANDTMESWVKGMRR